MKWEKYSRDRGWVDSMFLISKTEEIGRIKILPLNIMEMIEDRFDGYDTILHGQTVRVNHFNRNLGQRLILDSDGDFTDMRMACIH